MKTAEALIAINNRLSSELAQQQFSVSCVYNPLQYAARSWQSYVQTYAPQPKRVVFVGMNPGPWGMTQTGIPFGEVEHVRDWLEIEEEILPPPHTHPAKPVLGFACTRSEVSGRRFWGLMKEEFGSPEHFFKDQFVISYCPLTFIADTKQGKNVIPSELPAKERQILFQLCDRAVEEMLIALQAEVVIGIGRFAEQRLQQIIKTANPLLSHTKILHIIHPSPASPLANQNWKGAVRESLRLHEIW